MVPQKYHLGEVGVVKGGSTLLPGTYCRRLLQQNIIQFYFLALSTRHIALHMIWDTQFLPEEVYLRTALAP